MTSFFDDDGLQCDVVPLIVCEGDKYTVNAETATWLTEHRTPFAVIACAGKYRTGKSFLLNRLANAPSGAGFGVGNTVQACTKGLWVYKKWFPTSDPRKDILFVDTEGIDALDADDTHDVRIFTLALLLSSVFLYNSVGALDETSMQTLSLMSRVTQNVRVHSKSDESNMSDLAQHMPSFMWVLRDFALDLRNRQGKTISPNEYLEEALLGTDKSKDGIRAAIRDAFQKRELVTLPRPSTDDGNANNLEDRLYSVSAKFKKQVDIMRERLFEETRPFRSGENAVSGRMYVTLCQHLASVVQTNAVPVIKDSWTLMAAVATRDIKDSVVASFEEALAGLTKTPSKQLAVLLDSMRVRAVQQFDREAMVPVDTEVRKLLEQRLNALSDRTFQALARHVTEDACTAVDALEGKISETPTTASIQISEAETDFLHEFGNDDDTRNAWRVVLGDRLTHWLPRISSSFETKHSQLQLDLDTVKERHAALQREMHAIHENAAADFRVQTAENKQLLESKEAEVSSLQANNERLTNELIVLEASLRHCEAEIERIRVVLSGEDVEDTAEGVAAHSQEEDACDALRTELLKAQTDVRQSHIKIEAQRKQCIENEEKLRAMAATNEKLQENWEKGLHELQQSEAKARQCFEERLKTQQGQTESCENKIKEQQRQNELLQERIKGLAASSEMHGEIHENEKAQLRETAAKHRDQCESAQQRVIEIHKSMLDDLRARDERAREQQSSYLKERGELQSRVTDLVSENNHVKELLNASKRRIVEFDATDRECKRLKKQHQNDALVINRLEAENEQLKIVNTSVNDEKDRLRQENLTMEGELAVLRAEKQLNDARRTMSDTML